MYLAEAEHDYGKFKDAYPLSYQIYVDHIDVI